MTMSLDGFINDSSGSIEKLYSDFDEMHEAPLFKEMIKQTGAAIMGRRTFNMSGNHPDAWKDYEFQTPLFILTHTPPDPKPNEYGNLTFTFVQDGIESAIQQAKKAAGDKIVQVIGGASTVQQALNSGLCDELWVDVVPILLGNGLKLFENIDTLSLEKIKTEEVTPFRTALKLKIIKLH